MGTDITMIISRFSSTAVCVVGDVIVVVSCAPERSGGTNVQTIMHLRAYYPSPNHAPLEATVTQKRVSDLHAGTFVELFRYGVVPPVLASRDRLVIAPCSVQVTTRCEMTNENIPVIGRPPVWLRDGVNDATKLGIRDIPLQTRPRRAVSVTGAPVALVTISFTTDRKDVTIGDIYDS